MKSEGTDAQPVAAQQGVFDDRERKQLRRLLAALIPESGDGRMQAGDAPGVTEFVIEGLQAEPTHTAVLRSRLQAFSKDTDPEAFLRSLEQQAQATFSTLLRLCYMGYYSRADARRQLGLSPLPVHPAGYPVALESHDDWQRWLEPVKARGCIYRSTRGTDPEPTRSRGRNE